jgi:hypothetical protein
MTYAPTRRFAIGLSALALLAASCAGGGSGGTGTGGSGPGTGGNNSGTGGSVGTGGSSTGGATGTGGSVSTGGTPGTGGSVSTGGSLGTGGSGTGGATGGSTGTGGSPSTGGSTGTGGSAGKSGTGGAAGGGAATFFTDDFESDMMGKQPAGFDNLIAYNFNATNPQGDISTPTSSGSGAVADNTHVHGGKMAVHFHGAANPAFLELKLASGINHLYSRVWIYSSIQLGNGPSSDNHETLLGITGDPGSVNNQVRFGMIKGAIGTNQSATDDISPLQAKWYMPPMITANAWHCIELELDGTAAYNVLNAYSDGTLVHSISAGTDWQNGALKNTPNWLSGIFTDFMFGYQSFSSTTADVWMDDLALSTAGRIGCN